MIIHHQVQPILNQVQVAIEQLSSADRLELLKWLDNHSSGFSTVTANRLFDSIHRMPPEQAGLILHAVALKVMREKL